MVRLTHKAAAMFQDLRRRIFGVSEADGSLTGDNTTHEPAANELPLYLPESRLGSGEILAAESAGEAWEPWRVDPDGEQWFRRQSNTIHGVGPDAEVRAFDTTYDGDDDDSELPEEISDAN